MKNKNHNHNNNGFSLIEAMVAMAIIGFVIVTILGGFSHQQMATRKVTDKNIAIQLADMRMQETAKYSSNQLDLAQGITTEFILHREKTFDVYVGEDNDPDDLEQFRRTTVIERADILGKLISIRVMVEYGRSKQSPAYQFRVILSTMRGV